MEADFRALLAEDATIAGLVGTNDDGLSVAWNHVPQGRPDPAVTLYKITGAAGHHMQGSDGLAQTLVQIDIRARTFADLVAVRDAVVARLDAYKGIVGSTDFRGIFHRSERQRSDKTDTQLYHLSQLDFDVFSRSAA